MATPEIHRMGPARWKPGISLDRLERTDSAGATPGVSDPHRVVRGQALIFWDPKRPGHKLDAIDTDQITPAKDCVSESLDALDKNWKEGAFRFLMPDFRARVHRGQTFLVAGDRFAIVRFGSLPEEHGSDLHCQRMVRGDALQRGAGDGCIRGPPADSRLDDVHVDS